MIWIDSHGNYSALSVWLLTRFWTKVGYNLSFCKFYPEPTKFLAGSWTFVRVMPNLLHIY
jgi:hypothetical protein